MLIRTQKRALSDMGTGLTGVAIGIFGFCLLRFGAPLLALAPPCLFHLWTGIPCPSCGATRTGMALSHLRVADAFLANPLFFILFIVFILWGMNTMFAVVLGKNARLVLTPREKKLVQRLLVSAIIINWLYLITISI
ncbi:DUF2752 domain-containing protein [candidate division KSB1 bacterium]|nr:DUF2752 domain-containing protein [candidate division KSB1 bacterium]RQW10021.1 MAG: DUF2752 domain-containing protein [candidate division KSB1 bacterium]